MIEFTGERLIPGEVSADLWNEHFARYSLARLYSEQKRVLDVGCGAGYGTAHLAQSAAAVEAIDISPEAIGYARRHYPVANIAYLNASAAELPFRDASFELVTAFEVIEHLQDWPRLLSEAARVLAPEGLALISRPNRLYYTQSRGQEG